MVQDAAPKRAVQAAKPQLDALLATRHPLCILLAATDTAGRTASSNDA